MSSPVVRFVGPGLILFFLFLSRPITGTSEPLSVVINEIAWMGTKDSYNNEWVELYNNKSFQINLAGWRLTAQDDTPAINLVGVIPANGYFLLERTSDDTVPETPADQTYNGAMGNNGESLVLYDSSGNPIDSVNCSSGWFAGDNSTKQTMERKNPLLSESESDNWQMSQNPSGTPKAKNSIVVQAEPQPKPESEKPTVGEPTVEVILQQTYPTGVVVNEILPSPEGPDETDEWVEIFNQNDFSVDLSGWKIKDSAGKTAIFVFPKETRVPGQGFLVLSRPVTKITLNNDGDGISLIRPDGKITDSIFYEKAPAGQSYGKAETDWLWSAALTPGAKNTPPKPLTMGTKDKSLKTEILSGNGGAAAIGESSKKTENKEAAKSFLIFLIALTISLFSGIVILLVKKKLNSVN